MIDSHAMMRDISSKNIQLFLLPNRQITLALNHFISLWLRRLDISHNYTKLQHLDHPEVVSWETHTSLVPCLQGTLYQSKLLEFIYGNLILSLK